jgi:hypothetical protein
MAEFFELSAAERLEALVQAADASGRPPHLLEKDVWVVWSLRHLLPHPKHLIWVGAARLRHGTGVDVLNKAPYKYIRGIPLSVPARQWFDIGAHDFLALAIQSA